MIWLTFICTMIIWCEGAAHGDDQLQAIFGYLLPCQVDTLSIMISSNCFLHLHISFCVVSVVSIIMLDRVLSWIAIVLVKSIGNVVATSS